MYIQLWYILHLSECFYCLQIYLRIHLAANFEFLTTGGFLFEFDIDHILICIL